MRKRRKTKMIKVMLKTVFYVALAITVIGFIVTAGSVEAFSLFDYNILKFIIGFITGMLMMYAGAVGMNSVFVFIKKNNLFYLF